VIDYTFAGEPRRLSLDTTASGEDGEYFDGSADSTHEPYRGFDRRRIDRGGTTLYTAHVNRRGRIDLRAKWIGDELVAFRFARSGRASGKPYRFRVDLDDVTRTTVSPVQ